MSTNFQDRTAIVTGAAGDIGLAVTRALADGGATVWAVDVRPAPDGWAAPSGGQVHWATVDITDAAAVAALVDRVEQTSANLSLLVNGAGGPGSVRTPVDEVTDEQWNRVVDLNLNGLFYLCREVARVMKAAGRPGSMVTISSGAGRTYSRTGVQAYAAAKAGAIGLTRQLARELGAFDIRVNCIAPGLILSDGTRDELDRLPAAELDKHLSGVALGRLGVADDLVSPILFFLNDGSRYVSGQTISVDGGSTMLG